MIIIADAARVVVYLAAAVLIGRVLALVLERAGPRASGRLGAGLIVAGLAALVVAVARYGQQITPGAVLALFGTGACVVGTLLLQRGRAR